LKSASGSVLFTRKNKKKVERKLEMKKFDKATQKRETFKEVKK
jgi:ribosomal protein L33